MARAPIAALWVGGILQRRSDAYKAKLSIFATLVGLRHTPLSTELVRTLGTRLSQSGTDRRYGAGGEEWQLRRCILSRSAAMPQPNDPGLRRGRL
jgi:hypothetical protein